MGESSKERPGAAPEADYSQEFPVTPQERQRGRSAARKVDATKPARADPRDTAAPYRSTTYQGTEDPSRFSTPPPPKP
jgi:hypothetical protein